MMPSPYFYHQLRQALLPYALRTPILQQLSLPTWRQNGFK